MFTYEMIPVPLPPLAIDKIYRAPDVHKTEYLEADSIGQPSVIRLTLADETTLDLPFSEEKLHDLKTLLISSLG